MALENKLNIMDSIELARIEEEEMEEEDQYDEEIDFDEFEDYYDK